MQRVKKKNSVRTNGNCLSSVVSAVHDTMYNVYDKSKMMSKMCSEIDSSVFLHTFTFTVSEFFSRQHAEIWIIFEQLYRLDCNFFFSVLRIPMECKNNERLHSYHNGFARDKIRICFHSD